MRLLLLSLVFGCLLFPAADEAEEVFSGRASQTGDPCDR